MIKYAIGILASSLSIGAIADQSKFKTADDLFSSREGSIENTQAARAAYLEVAKNVTGADLVRAVVGAARTIIYEGEALTGMIEKADVERRKSIFRECFDEVTPLINKKVLGYDSPAYYYFSAACMGYYAQVSSTLENLRNIKRLNDTLKAGYATQGGDIYEGGGLKRVHAALKSNPKAKPLPGGFYNPEAGLQLINESLASEAYPGNHKGEMFCENSRRKVDVLIELKQIEVARNFGATAVEEFEFLLDLEEIPAHLTSETKHCVSKMKEKIESL